MLHSTLQLWEELNWIRVLHTTVHEADVTNGSESAPISSNTTPENSAGVLYLPCSSVAVCCGIGAVRALNGTKTSGSISTVDFGKLTHFFF